MANLNDQLKAFLTGSGTLNDELMEAMLAFEEAGGTAGTLLPAMGEQLTTGFCTIPDRRTTYSSTVALVNQTLSLAYFTAPKTMTATSVVTYTGGTAQASATVARIGVFSVGDSGDLTLIGSTTHNANLWNSTNSAHTETLTTPASFVAGRRYAAAPLCVGGTPPTLICFSSGAAGIPIMNTAPRIIGTRTGQADLPASISAGDLSNAQIAIQMTFLP